MGKSLKKQNDTYLSSFLGSPTRIFILMILMIVILFPFYWLASNAFKVEQDYFAKPPVLFPVRSTLNHFYDIFVKHGAFKALMNSVAIASFTTVFTLIIGSLASYSLVNGMLPGKIKKVLASWFLIQKMYPAVVVAVPVFFVINKLHLMDSVFSLVLMNTSFNLPLVILLMIGFYTEAPYEVEEQGMLEGCNLFQRYFFITTPMVKSGLVAVGMLTFIATWNEFLYAVILTIKDAKPLTVTISGFITDKGLLWGPMAAMGCLVILPVLILMWFMQRDFVSGISAGALKG
ncbi:MULTISPECIES: carbohydrate ABC transporter permease [unclassified Oceanispirochaeta]|uniref:carbohydrate ABC transporter permease n=1 Tax=unclassified Oceanispirochaeta TaxID=2635722 RepID=UPI000E0959D6|nr:MULTISPECIES: carbohydrate ABC transporter permease [unclassified Oceanispirochaeta]MBF9018463.1 carbohydrate ABC transporter permease [Oceanispirochaeta sp. M2]NPD74869.1 carbohydrate ABC transporter permease [Oceanispirochaeta sp. M1]RDG29257.1 carbohydrate ABC transporter permease [Oceanispirochaeta sp. M1]